MEANNKREDHPRDINPNEIGRREPAKEIKAQEKVDIKQSEMGREMSQTPADEHIETFSQIDDDASAENKTIDPNQNAGYMNDSTSADRDTGNHENGGWEESRTARHK